MVGKLFSAVTVSLATLAPVQFAQAQDAMQDGTPFATAAVYAEDSNWHKVLVNPGTTYLYLTGSGAEGAELDLFVYNQSGTLLASNTDPGDQATLRVLSKQTAVLYVEIANVGKIDSKYEFDFATPAPRTTR